MEPTAQAGLDDRDEVGDGAAGRLRGRGLGVGGHGPSVTYGTVGYGCVGSGGTGRARPAAVAAPTATRTAVVAGGARGTVGRRPARGCPVLTGDDDESTRRPRGVARCGLRRIRAPGPQGSPPGVAPASRRRHARRQPPVGPGPWGRHGERPPGRRRQDRGAARVVPRRRRRVRDPLAPLDRQPEPRRRRSSPRSSRSSRRPSRTSPTPATGASRSSAPSTCCLSRPPTACVTRPSAPSTSTG